MTKRFWAVARKLIPPAVRAWRARMIVWARRRRFASLSNEEVFSEIYRRHLWGGEQGFVSGYGSEARFADTYVEAIRHFIRQHDIRRVVDVGCGDFRIGARISEGIDYVGVDVVPTLIDHHRQQHQTAHTSFVCLDATTQSLPAGDLCLIRQVLQHLSNAEIERVLNACRHFPFVIITEHFPAGNVERPNVDKPHGPDIRLSDGSAVCLDQPPFSRRIAAVLCEATLETDGSRLVTMLIDQHVTATGVTSAPGDASRE